MLMDTKLKSLEQFLLKHAWRWKKKNTLFSTGNSMETEAICSYASFCNVKQRQTSSTKTHVLLILIQSAKHPSVTSRHPWLILSSINYWDFLLLPSLPHHVMMLSWAQLNLNLKCQQLTLIKRSGTLTLRTILHGMSSSLIFGREELWNLILAESLWMRSRKSQNAAILMEVIHFWIALYTGGAFEISTVNNINDRCIVGTLLGPCGADLLSSQFRIYFDNISGDRYIDRCVSPTHVQSVGSKSVAGSMQF